VFKEKVFYPFSTRKTIKSTCEKYVITLFSRQIITNFNNEYRKRIKQKKRIEMWTLCSNWKPKSTKYLQKGGLDESILACSTCIDQIETPGNEENHGDV
jgi:hypothetical protein